MTRGSREFKAEKRWRVRRESNVDCRLTKQFVVSDSPIQKRLACANTLIQICQPTRSAVDVTYCREMVTATADDQFSRQFGLGALSGEDR